MLPPRLHGHFFFHTLNLMRFSRFTERDFVDLHNYQLSALGIGLSRGEFNISDVGHILPGSVMVHNLSEHKITYMNDWGCNKLDHSLNDLVALGDEYYSRFFFGEEARIFMAEIAKYVERQDTTVLYSFPQRVKIGPKADIEFYHTSAKLLPRDCPHVPSNSVLIIANPVPEMQLTATKLAKFMHESAYAAKNHKRFLLLTPREKEIITLLAEGKSSSQIAETLFLSCHTVTTHRKNISRKLNFHSFAELVKFANAFDLVHY